jgi:hypothetical protein
MAQGDMNIANQGFPAFRADLNDQLEALVTNSSGATEPSTKFPHQFWVDTAADPSVLKIRNEDNDAWITIGEIDQTGDKFNLNCANATIAENLSLNAQGDLRFFDSDSSNYVAFQAPATVSSNLTWTLPATDGASGEALTTNGSGTLSWAAATPTIASTAEAQAGTNNTNFITPLRMREGFNASGSAPVYACRAWVNFDGTNASIRASGNVSSVTSNGTGDYTVNFATAMPDVDYSAQANTQTDGAARAANANINTSMISGTIVAPTTTTLRVGTYNTATNLAFDSALIAVAIFR